MSKHTLDFAKYLAALYEQGFPDGTRATTAEAARRAKAAGYDISRSYFGQLRTGHAPNPSYEVIAALATIFEVEPNYFFGVPNTEPRPPALGDDLHTVARGHLESYARFLAHEYPNTQ